MHDLPGFLVEVETDMLWCLDISVSMESGSPVVAFEYDRDSLEIWAKRTQMKGYGRRMTCFSPALSRGWRNGL
jgi:hypothetical protein